MVKQFVAAIAALFLAFAAHAAIDVNKATQAELEAIKGIGPSLSTSIVSERKKSEFKDWSDLMGRVKGVGERSAAKFSDAGLTVHGKPYAGVAPAAGETKAAKSQGRTDKTAQQSGRASKSGATASATSAAQR
jgi:competence protein ComEA